LLDNPYDLFKLTINGVMTPIQLDKAAVKAADTYEQLYMDPFSYASTLIFDVEVRLLTYIRPLTAAPS